MYQYKTVVTDYEGMQETLTVYGEQGWKLVSVTPDTYRLVTAKLGENRSLGMSGDEHENTQEFSASYYLLVLQRDDEPVAGHAHEVAAEALDYPEFSLPDY